MTPDPARRATMWRLMVVHFVAYPVALPWAIAALPLIFAWKEQELLALADERDAVTRVVAWTLGPAFVAFVAAHLPGIRWIRAARAGTRRGRALFVGATVALALAGTALAALAWQRTLPSAPATPR